MSEKSGEQLINEYWTDKDFPDFDLGQNYFEIASQESLRQAQPAWFSTLVQAGVEIRTEPNSEERRQMMEEVAKDCFVSIHQVHMINILILKSLPVSPTED